MFAGYHRIWNNAVAVRHPSLWTFIRCIKDQQSAIENSVEAVDNGEPTIKRRKKWRDLEDRFLRLRNEYNKGVRDVGQYWDAITHGIVQF